MENAWTLTRHYHGETRLIIASKERAEMLAAQRNELARAKEVRAILG